MDRGNATKKFPSPGEPSPWQLASPVGRAVRVGPDGGAAAVTVRRAFAPSDAAWPCFGGGLAHTPPASAVPGRFPT